MTVIIVGAGIVGCAAAVALGRDGRKVMLIERDWSEPDRIVGELLQPGGVEALEVLGLEDCLKGIDAVPVQGYTVFQKSTGESVHLPYPRKEGTGRKQTGYSFHHGKFIMNLRKAVMATSNVQRIEGTVNQLVHCKETNKAIGVTYTPKKQQHASNDTKSEAPEPQNVYAPLTLVADGCFSKFRKQYLPKEPIVKSHFVGFVLEDCDLPYPNHGHVVLAEPSPILLYQIGTRDTRILIDIPGKLPSQSNGDLQNYIRTHVGPQIPTSAQKSFYKALETERLRVMPN
ncbi:Squalene epoxidase, partial [Chytridiales sp. JEL 0842]